MTSKVWIRHRKKVFDLMEDSSILIVKSNLHSEERENVQRNYYFLTGNAENDNIVLLAKSHGKEYEMIFIAPYDELEAKWVGTPLSKEEVRLQTGIASVRYRNEFDSVFYRMLGSHAKVYLDFSRENRTQMISEEEVFAEELRKKNPWLEIKNAHPLFSTARTVKSSEEIEAMKKAIAITQKGIEAILSHIGPMKEYQLESYFDQAIKYHGATGYAFPTIAASGKNATCLHYQENQADAEENDLILFDLGASYHMYCADISRTFPISGKFTPRQKEIYNIVLKGQEEVMKAAKPNVTTCQLNEILVAFFAKELKRIGLIEKDEEVGKYYYHGVSHHIGLECHDLCDYTPLQAGSIISDEPGLYIEEEGIGIRIEDDLLITEDGCVNLSEGIIKTVEDIENFIQKAKEGR